MRFPHLFAAAAGFVAVAAYAPFGLFLLILPSLMVLFRLWAGASRVRTGFSLGLAWGLGLFLGGVSWLFVALHRYGGMPAPIAGFAIVLFCGYLALFPAVAGALWVGLRRGGPWRDGLLAAALWTFSEWLRGALLTGFPWLALGYSQSPPSPLAGYAPVIGVYGVGFVVALSAAWAAPLVSRARVPAAVLVAAALLWGGGAVLRERPWSRPSGAPLGVALIQTDVEQSLKWRPNLVRQWLQLNLQLVREYPARLVVLPETAFPMLVEQLPAGYLPTLGDAVEGVGGDLVFGAFVREPGGEIHNAALSVGSSGSQRYAKKHLVPFGEYSPPLFGWFYDWANIPMSDQTPGGTGQAPLTFDDQRVAVNICYEDLFGGEIARAARNATILLNISNLAWYGDSLAQPQHLQIARMRALETGRPIIRSTNTGMTAIIEPDGRIAGVLPPFERGALRAEVQGFSGDTPYLEWGDRGPLALAGAAAALALLGRRRRRDSA